MANVADFEPHRSALYRYALYQLHDEAAAHDVVQETFLGALEKLDSFAGDSSLKTWLTAILKHKVLDVQRRLYRDPLLINPNLDEEDLSDLDTLFDRSGHWGTDAPRRWQKPEDSLEDQQFWVVYEKCCLLMPRRSAMIFAMREISGLEIAEICQELEVSATNCSVMLYRARMSLRLCLEKNWFGVPS